MQICKYKERKEKRALWISHMTNNQTTDSQMKVCFLVSPSEDTGLQTGISGSSPEHKTEV